MALSIGTHLSVSIPIFGLDLQMKETFLTPALKRLSVGVVSPDGQPTRQKHLRVLLKQYH